MDIKFHGNACFSIQAGKLAVVTDPYGDSTGLKLPTLKANVVTVSGQTDAHNNAGAIQGEPVVLDWPGEYESSGIHVRGVHSMTSDSQENIIFSFHLDGVHFCHLGSLGVDLSDEQLEKVSEADVLFVPVGGGRTLTAKKAKELVEAIDPRIVIPMLYKSEGSKLDLEPLEAFVSIMGAQNVERVDSFSLKKSDLPEDNSKVVLLNVV